MHIAFDMQACQTINSAKRGVGKYSYSLMTTFMELFPDYKYSFLANSKFPYEIDCLREDLKRFSPEENFHVLNVHDDTFGIERRNDDCRLLYEYLYEQLVASIAPDILHSFNLFEGLVENAVTSVGKFNTPWLNTLTLHDIIPYRFPERYFSDKRVERWYYSRLQQLGRADGLLANSAASRSDAIKYLHIDPKRAFNVSAAIDPVFKPVKLAPDELAALRQRTGLTRATFIMYTGGFDPRKNIDGLIIAYAMLPEGVRRTRQLAIVCSASASDRDDMLKLAAKHGLGPKEVLITGFVPEADLIALYSTCELFIFPSLYEGFGLPVLEAMACGAPTIVADNSSLPEVSGNADALFSVDGPEPIAQKMAQVLNDGGLRRSLSKKGLARAKDFSWKRSAELAHAAFVTLTEGKKSASSRSYHFGLKPTLAFVSPVPADESGIADYSAELIQPLSRHYDITVINDLQRSSDPWIDANCRLLSVSDFREGGKEATFDRILYQVGNSDYHEHMFDLTQRRPGTVVLHDLFLSGIQHWREHHHKKRDNFARALVDGHGYGALYEHMNNEWDYAIWKYPLNSDIIANSSGLIVHSQFSHDYIKNNYTTAGDSVRLLPHLRWVAEFDRQQARDMLGLADDELMICSFGFVGKSKLNREGLEGFLKSSLATGGRARFVFVGGTGDEYGANLREAIAQSELKDRISVTGYAAPELYRRYMAACDIAVQLRTKSRGETSGTVLDCFAHGVPVIVNAHGTLAELPSDCCEKLPDPVTPTMIAAALDKLKDASIRAQLGKIARAKIERDHRPIQIADDYRDAIEAFHDSHPRLREQKTLQAAVQTGIVRRAAAADILKFALAIDDNSGIPAIRRRCFADLSELVRKDWGSGIQRVVKNLLFNMFIDPPAGYDVIPVYMDRDGGEIVYRHARKYASSFLGYDYQGEDEVILPRAGDMFYGLDLYPSGVYDAAQVGLFRDWRLKGVEVYFLIHDLLAIHQARYFLDGAFGIHSSFYDALADSASGIICVSRTVADDLIEWMGNIHNERTSPIKIGYFHLGCEILALEKDKSAGNFVLPDFRSRPTFLTVGTIEPRKGQEEILKAFETLWAAGEDINLVIVGKPGWMMESLVKYMETHAEFGKRLFWWKGLTDLELSKVYAAAECIVCASYGEGFGLPLIEAAAHGVPILARDIPVFREVAGNSATFFSSNPGALVDAIRSAAKQIVAKTITPSTGVKRLTWRQSYEEMRTVMFEGQWYDSVRPSAALSFGPYSEALSTAVGRRENFGVRSTGQEGFLVYGPYAALKAGTYLIHVYGKVGAPLKPGGFVDAAVDKGKAIVGKAETLEGLEAGFQGQINDRLQIVLDKDCTDLEIRLKIMEGDDVTFYRYVVTQE